MPVTRPRHIYSKRKNCFSQNMSAFPSPRLDIPDNHTLQNMFLFHKRVVTRLTHSNNHAAVPWPDVASMFNLDRSKLPLKYQSSLRDKNTRTSSYLIDEITEPLTDQTMRESTFAMVIHAHQIYMDCDRKGAPEVPLEHLYARMFAKSRDAHAELVQKIRGLYY